MQIIIDINEDIAQGIIDGKNDAPRNIVRAFQATIADAIKNGTPLSKTIDSLKELSKDHRHNYISNSHEERAWRLGIEDSIDLLLTESKDGE